MVRNQPIITAFHYDHGEAGWPRRRLALSNAGKFVEPRSQDCIGSQNHEFAFANCNAIACAFRRPEIGDNRIGSNRHDWADGTK